MKLSSMLIRKDYKIEVAELSVNGKKGSIAIKQNSTQCRTDVASVIVKIEGEKAVTQKINTMVEFEGLKDYLSEFYVNAEFVSNWSI